MKQFFPFDPLSKNHILIGLLLAIWVFVFLYFTEPLDVNQFSDKEKLLYLPAYGLLGVLLYVINLPFQYWLYKKQKKQWYVISEFFFISVFIIIAIIMLRLFYLHVIMDWHPNAYLKTALTEAITVGWSTNPFVL